MKGQETFQKANLGQHKVRAECGDGPSGTKQVTDVLLPQLWIQVWQGLWRQGEDRQHSRAAYGWTVPAGPGERFHIPPCECLSSLSHELRNSELGLSLLPGRDQQSPRKETLAISHGALQSQSLRSECSCRCGLWALHPGEISKVLKFGALSQGSGFREPLPGLGRVRVMKSKGTRQWPWPWRPCDWRWAARTEILKVFRKENQQETHEQTPNK